MTMDASHIIGIDLGTTNSAVSFVDIRTKAKEISIFRIPQLVAAGEFSDLPMLPSFLYIPGKYDISEDAISVPWETGKKYFAGAYARDHGAKVPVRLVSSAKSWLCHPDADPKAKILPLGTGEGIEKISPVEAQAAYLEHIRNTWNRTRGDEVSQYIENQTLLITVPASFDKKARELTKNAASMAGLKNITLLEEPLAAFCNWFACHEHDWRKFITPGEVILVCDVGGGSTDFTLIALRISQNILFFERIAAGEHLLLGGDNFDLALARYIEERVLKSQQGNLFARFIQYAKNFISGTGPEKKTSPLDNEMRHALRHECRRAKEVIINGEAESVKVVVTGEGSQVIGGAISHTLKYSDVRNIILEGFFPLADKTGASSVERRGISEFGLQYEQEPAITRHLRYFLEQHRTHAEKLLNRKFQGPDLILFNGGSLKSEIIQERIRKAICIQFKRRGRRVPRILENPDPDLSAAAGAASYGIFKMRGNIQPASDDAWVFHPPADKSSKVPKMAKDQVEEASDSKLLRKSSDRIIMQHVYASMAIGLIPLPFADFLGVTTVELNLIRRLAKLYEIPFSRSFAKNLSAALIGSVVPVSVGAKLAMGFSKAIPGPGYVFGAISMSGVSAASTYALGKVFNRHFAEGGTFLSFDPEKAREFYAEMFEEGRQKVVALNAQKTNK